MNGLISFVSQVIEKRDAIEAAVRKADRMLAFLGTLASEEGRNAK